MVEDQDCKDIDFVNLYHYRKLYCDLMLFVVSELLQCRLLVVTVRLSVADL